MMMSQAKWQLLIVSAVFMQAILSVGPLYNFNVFLVPLQTEFESSAVFTGWVGSLGSAALCFVSPLTAMLTWRLGRAPPIFLGNILMVAGCLSTSFISSLAYGYLTFGLLVGLGAGCMFCGSTILLLEWFMGHRQVCRALATTTTGSSVGVMVFGPLLNTLTAAYGWRNCFRILSGITLSLGLVTALPFLRSPRRVEGQSVDKTPPDDKAEQCGEPHEDPRDGVTETCDEDPARKRFGTMKNLRMIAMDVEVWLWVTAITLAQLGWSFVIINYSSFLGGLGLSTANISLALTVLGAAEVGGKIVVAVIGDRLPCLMLYVTAGASVVSAIVSGFMTLSSTLWSIIVISVVWGYCRGTVFASSAIAAVQLFGRHGHRAVAVISLLGYGIGVLIGAPITGVFYDLTGNYTLSLFAVVASFGLSTLCQVLIPIKRKLASRCRRERSEPDGNPTKNGSLVDDTKLNPAVPGVQTRGSGISNPTYERDSYSE